MIMFEQWVPLLVAIFGGVGVKLVEVLVTRSGKKIDMEAEIRKELRDVVRDQDSKIQALMDEVDVWKQKYYEILEQLVGYERLKVKYEEMKKQLFDKSNV